MKSNQFTIKDFNNKYTSDDVCLEEIFQNRFVDLKICPKCNRETKFYRVTNRKAYSCQFCGHQLHPLADTIFHKSDTSLKSWFYAIYLFSTSKNGVSAKELERHLGVTYKTAWRMAKQIRLLFAQSQDILKDTVEIDETYVGGKGRNNKRGRGSENKAPVIDMIERKGNVVAKVVINVKSSTVMPLIRNNVRLDTRIITDEYNIYNKLKTNGYYKHDRILHKVNSYVVGDIYTNTIEGFWSQLKRSIDGTYHRVSLKYLQSYVNEFSFRYNLRASLSPLFHQMLSMAGMPV